MSEQANLEAVRQVYAAFVWRDLPSILELQADDARWSVAGPADQIPWAAHLQAKRG